MVDDSTDQPPATQPPATIPAKPDTGTSSTGAKGSPPGSLKKAPVTKDDGTSSTGARQLSTKSEQRVVRPDKTRGRE